MKVTARENRENALQDYKEAKSNYILNSNNENWILFCNAKRKCMLLGIRI